MEPTIDVCDACGRTDELQAIADLMACDSCRRVTCRYCGANHGAWWPDLGCMVCRSCGHSWTLTAGD